jgi:hypothetical protein
MSVRPRLHACKRTPAPVGAPVHGSLHGPCIDLKPGVLLPTPTPTDGGNEGGETLVARFTEQGMKIVDAGREQLNELSVYDQASRQMFDMIDNGSWFRDTSKEYRQQKRELFAKYVEQQASKVFGKLKKADVLAPLQNRRRRLPNDYRQVGDYNQERANDFYKQEREFLVLEGLIELVYRMVDKKEKREKYTNELRSATRDVHFREERVAISRQNLNEARAKRDNWERAKEATEKQLNKLTSDREYITAHDLYDHDVVHHPKDAIAQALDETAPPLANDELEAPEGDGEDWAMKQARKERKEYESTRRGRNLPPLASDYIRARDLRETETMEKTLRDDDDDSEFSDDCSEREGTDDPCFGGADASKEVGIAQKDAIAAARARKEAAAVDGDKWKPIPEVLGPEWGENGWAEFEINKERTTVRRSLDGEYVYYTAIKNGAGVIENFTDVKDGGLRV